MSYTVVNNCDIIYYHFGYDRTLSNPREFARSVRRLLNIEHIGESEDRIVNFIWRSIIVSDNFSHPTRYLDEEEITTLFFDNAQQLNSNSKHNSEKRRVAPPA